MRRGLTAGGLGTEQPMSHLEGWQQPMNPWTSEPKVSPKPKSMREAAAVQSAAGWML